MFCLLYVRRIVYNDFYKNGERCTCELGTLAVKISFSLICLEVALLQRKISSVTIVGDILPIQFTFHCI